jgi:outer membrane immunogenic protein
LGYVYAERWLVYARGGAAWTHEKIDDAFVGPVVGFLTDPNTASYRTGWTAGTGVEWAFAPHWSANVEYNYYDFGGKSLVLTSPVNHVNIADFKDTIHAATAGVNYHF